MPGFPVCIHIQDPWDVGGRHSYLSLKTPLPETARQRGQGTGFGSPQFVDECKCSHIVHQDLNVNVCFVLCEAFDHKAC